MSQNLTGIIAWLKNWFYDKDEFDEIIESIPIGDTITTLTLVPYAENPNGIICYEGGDNPTPTPVTVDSVTLVSSTLVLSYLNSQDATLTATVLDENEDGINGQTVNFYKDGTLLDSKTTNSNGVASLTYNSVGNGDVLFTAECSDINSNNVTIEDCYFYKGDELSYTSSATNVSTAIVELGNINNFNFVMEFDIKSNGNGGGLNIGASSQHNPPSSANYREYIGTDSHKFSFNNRTTSSSNTTTGTVTDNTYYHMKLTKSGTSFTGYYGDNNTSIATKNATWISNYTTYNLYWINWSSTNYVKNIKIKKVI